MTYFSLHIYRSLLGIQQILSKLLNKTTLLLFNKLSNLILTTSP